MWTSARVAACRSRSTASDGRVTPCDKRTGSGADAGSTGTGSGSSATVLTWKYTSCSSAYATEQGVRQRPEPIPNVPRELHEVAFRHHTPPPQFGAGTRIRPAMQVTHYSRHKSLG